MARTRIRRLAATRVVAAAMRAVERIDGGSPHALRVLTYHRVDAPAAFREHVEHLERCYTIVSVPRVLTALEGGPCLPRRSVLLTFDDAYRSFAEVAWPILRRRGHPAAVFVPTAYPDSDLPAYWWDRLASAFATTTMRTPVTSRLGALPLATPEQRLRSHARLKAHVRQLRLERANAEVDELCTALGLPRMPHEVLGWEQLRRLAAEGVIVGAHSRTHPRLDLEPPARARTEVVGSLRDIERELPGGPLLFAFPDGRFDEALVELLRSRGVELAFTTRRGTNDLRSCDVVRLRRVPADANDPVSLLRAKLVLSSPRSTPVLRLLHPPSNGERRAERVRSRERRRSGLVLRALDAALTSRLLPHTPPVTSLLSALSPALPRAQRLRLGVGSLCSLVPGLERTLARALCDPGGLPLRVRSITLAGRGSGATVFSVELEGGRRIALKVYRRTLGRERNNLLAAARRYRSRHARMLAAFGDVLQPGTFLVLRSPLRGAPAVACVQPWLPERRDVLGVGDAELRRLAEGDDALARDIRGFARATLSMHREGSFPDLLGSSNLVAVPTRDGPRLRLIDYGLFDPTWHPPSGPERAAIDAVAHRLQGLLVKGQRHVEPTP